MEDNVTRRLLVDDLTADPAPFGNPEDDFARHRAVISGMRDAGADDNAIRAYLVSQGISSQPWRGGQAAPMTRVAETAQSSSVMPSPTAFAQRAPSTATASSGPTIADDSVLDPTVEAAKARQGWARALSRRHRNLAVRSPYESDELIPAPGARVNVEHPDTSDLWPVAPSPTEPGRAATVGPHYLAPVRHGPRMDTIIPAPTPWSPRSALPSATSWGASEPGMECVVSGGNLHCTTPGGMRVTVPAEGLAEGFRIAPGEPNYHYYDVPDGPRSVDPAMLTQGVINRPTPGPTEPFRLVYPATPEGTINEATPPMAYFAYKATAQELPDSPMNQVKSYVTTDQAGRTVVVNVTRPTHGLHPGVVIRYVTQSPEGAIIQNEGAGLGALQGPGNQGALRDHFNGVWEGQADKMIKSGYR